MTAAGGGAFAASLARVWSFKSVTLIWSSGTIAAVSEPSAAALAVALFVRSDTLI